MMTTSRSTDDDVYADEVQVPEYVSRAYEINGLLDEDRSDEAARIVKRDIDEIERIRQSGLSPDGWMGTVLGALRTFAEGGSTVMALKEELRSVSGVGDPTVAGIVSAYLSM